jgi:hypothetical protein
MVGKIATGEIEDDVDTQRAISVGSRGGKLRADKLSPERRAEIARSAARARWETPSVPSEEEGS